MSERQIPVRRIPVPVRYIGEYGTGIEVVQARAPSQVPVKYAKTTVPVKYAKTTVPRWYRSAKAIERRQKAKRYRDFTPKGANQPIPPSAS